jgi:hypothetical protein
MTKNYVTPTEVGSYNLRNPIILIPTLIVTKSGKNKWTLNSKHFPKWACWANYCFQRTLKFHGLK